MISNGAAIVVVLIDAFWAVMAWTGVLCWACCAFFFGGFGFRELARARRRARYEDCESDPQELLSRPYDGRRQ